MNHVRRIILIKDSNNFIFCLLRRKRRRFGGAADGQVFLKGGTVSDVGRDRFDTFQLIHEFVRDEGKRVGGLAIQKFVILVDYIVEPK